MLKRKKLETRLCIRQHKLFISFLLGKKASFPFIAASFAATHPWHETSCRESLSLESYNEQAGSSEPLEVARLRKPCQANSCSTNQAFADGEEIVSRGPCGTRIHAAQLPGGIGDGKAQPFGPNFTEDRECSQCPDQGAL